MIILPQSIILHQIGHSTGNRLLQLFWQYTAIKKINIAWFQLQHICRVKDVNTHPICSCLSVLVWNQKFHAVILSTSEEAVRCLKRSSNHWLKHAVISVTLHLSTHYAIYITSY
jgi:hypothetical protein